MVAGVIVFPGNCGELVPCNWLPVPLCKQRSGFIAYNGAGHEAGMAVSQSP